MVNTAPTRHIFLHVQKTAGSSLRNSLISAYGENDVALLYPAALGMTVAYFLTLPAAQRSLYQFIMGHFFFGLHKALPGPTRYIAFLREPIARVRSQIQQHLRFKSRFYHDGQEIDLVTAVNEGLSEEFDNLQLRILAGTSSGEVPLGAMGEAQLRQAIENLLSHFGFIGLMEEINEEWPRLLTYLNLPPMILHHDNISENLPEAEAIFAKIDWGRVTNRHAEEITIYHLVKNRLQDNARQLAS